MGPHRHGAQGGLAQERKLSNRHDGVLGITPVLPMIKS